MVLVAPGEMIVNLREVKGISQTELAEAIKINRSVLNRIELGTRPLREDELQKIADYFKVSTDFLLDRTPPKVATIIQEVLASENKCFILEAIKTMPDEDVAEVGRYVVFRQLLRQQPKLELLLGHDPFNKKTAANGEKGATS